MAKTKSPLAVWSEYIGVRAATGLMQCFDTDQNLATAGRLGAMFHHLNRGRRERAEYNIRYSFPDMNDAEVSALAEQSMRYMFQLFMVDPFVMPRLVTPATWPQYVRFGHVQTVLERMVQQRAAIFITAHVGNWELLGFSLAVLGFPIHAVARPLDNTKLNDWLLGVRESRGMHIITKWGATTILEDLLTHGGQVGFTADQNAGEQGTFVPFFGRLASSYKSISLLAMRFNVPIICGYARRIGQRFSYQIECADIIEPEDWADQVDPLFYVTARYNRAIETMVRQAPDQYLWIHRRWKSRPKHELQGKPVPDKLRKKLESLPWMTQVELDRIVGHSNESAARFAVTL